MFTKGFYVDLAERTIATFAQALGAVLLGAGTGLLEVDWIAAVSVAGMAALLAVLKAFAAGVAGEETGASFGASIPKASVAAVEDKRIEGKYEAEEAAGLPVGTPVDVVPEDLKVENDPDKFDHGHRF